jgi:hypothetical protein
MGPISTIGSTASSLPKHPLAIKKEAKMKSGSFA